MVHNVTFTENTIALNEAKGKTPKLVGIYVGPQTDFITLSKNTFSGPLKQAIVNDSKGTHNQIAVQEAKR